MNEKNSKKTSPREVLRLLSKELTPEETPYEIRTNVPRPSTFDDSTYELRKRVPESSTTTEDSISSKMIKSQDASNISNNTLSISNFTSLSFGLDDSNEESLLLNRNQNIRQRLRNKRAENPFVIPSESILKTPAPAEKTVDDLGLSVVSLDESIDISKAKKEIEKKRKRNHMEVEFLNLTSAVSKLYENVDINANENEDSIDLNKEKNPKSRFRKSRKSVHFDISPLINAIPNVNNETDLKLPEKENNDNSISKLSSEELESPENNVNNLESPKSKVGGLESPKRKAGGLESPKRKAGGLESPKSKEGGLGSPKSKERGLESPKSKERGLESPTKKRRLESPKSKEVAIQSPKRKVRGLQSPKSKERGLESPKSKEGGLESPKKKRRLESPKSKEVAIQSPKSKVRGLQSPKSKERGLESPKSKVRGLQSPKSKERGSQSPKSKEGGLESPKSKEGSLESPKRKDKSSVAISENSIPFEDLNFEDNENSLHIEPNSKHKTFLGQKKRKSVHFDLDDIISKMEKNKYAIVNENQYPTNLEVDENHTEVNKSVTNILVSNVDVNTQNTLDSSSSKGSIHLTLSPNSIMKQLGSPKSGRQSLASQFEGIQSDSLEERKEITATYSKAVDTLPSVRLKRNNQLSLSPKSIEKQLKSPDTASVSPPSSPSSASYNLGSSKSRSGDHLIPEYPETHLKSPKTTHMSLRSSPISTSYHSKSPITSSSGDLTSSLMSPEKQLNSPKRKHMSLRSSPTTSNYSGSPKSSNRNLSPRKSHEKLFESPKPTSSPKSASYLGSSSKSRSSILSPHKSLEKIKSPKTTHMSLRSSPTSSDYSGSPKSRSSNLSPRKSHKNLFESPKSPHMSSRSSPKSASYLGSSPKSRSSDLSPHKSPEKLESPKTTRMSLRSSPKSASNLESPKSKNFHNISSDNQLKLHKSRSNNSLSSEGKGNKSGSKSVLSSPSSTKSSAIDLETTNARKSLIFSSKSPSKLLETTKSSQILQEGHGNLIEEKSNSSKKTLSPTKQNNLDSEMDENIDNITDVGSHNPDTFHNDVTPTNLNLSKSKESFHSQPHQSNTKTFPASSSFPESSVNITEKLLNYPTTHSNIGKSFDGSLQSPFTVNRNKKRGCVNNKASPKPSTSKSGESKSGQLTLKEFLERLKNDQTPKKPQPDLFQEMIKKPKVLIEINEKYKKEKNEKNKGSPKKKKETTQTKTNLPPKMNDFMFQHFLKHKLTKEGSEVLQEVVGGFFKNLAEDLSVVLTSSHDKLINKNHIYLLMKQLKIVSNWEELYALTEELLPANEWKKLVPIQYAHNKVFPQPPRERRGGGRS